MIDPPRRRDDDAAATAAERPRLSFEEVYEAHFDFVWRSLRRLGVGEDALPDALQDAFLVVHRKLATFEGRAKITTWLFSICLRVAGERRREAHVRREISDPDAARAIAAPIAGADDLVDRTRRLAWFERALDRLPLEQRAAFVLFELEGFSGEEIAAALAIPEGTVRSRLRLARAAFSAAVRELAGETARPSSPPIEEPNR